MAEYIEREALLSELQEEIEFETSMYTEEQNKYFNIGLKCAIRDVKSQPAADVAEVKLGEWTKDDSDGCFCSFCGWYTDYDYDYVTNNGLGNDDFIYCSHCGARMDGGANDEM